VPHKDTKHDQHLMTPSYFYSLLLYCSGGLGVLLSGNAAAIAIACQRATKCRARRARHTLKAAARSTCCWKKGRKKNCQTNT
jgi:hypothetical protein